ncbi:MAG: transketolase [Anaerolineae bacterium UTCFX2]|jgi:transketolase|nr:transketolase [Anaerolineales bacterium]OQY89310.1 MAG: transketolase [Anaerolineae bacterium UTCFX2]
MNKTDAFAEKAINTIRFLSADAVENANSGHPGLPMGDASMAFTVWTRHLRHNPQNPKWPNRDRFVLSGGHGSMLLYSLLYLTGYGLELDELKQFRQWGSRTPGHPEYGHTPGVEVTTGPLGQGFGNGVGMAIAGKHLAAEFNQPGYPIFDYFVYGIVTDGDLMEGVASEAASLAGHLGLGNLIYLYDDNRVSIDGGTDLAFTEDRLARFRAYEWHVQQVADGNDVDAIDEAITQAKNDPRPSLIAVRTVIGYGLPHKEGTSAAHGEPPGESELNGAKRNLGWPLEPWFLVPADVLEFFRQAIGKGEEANKAWNDLFNRYGREFGEAKSELERRLEDKLPRGWALNLPEFAADPKGMATRASSGEVLNALALKLPELLGGSADLAPSTKTWINDQPAFQKDSPEGRNFHFGVREHGMGAIVNGMAVSGGLIPYGGTFLVFSDYMRGALRLAALAHYPSIWVFTHDSIGLGEDGPTHQPVEHLAALRCMPNMLVIRPGDANEVREAWKIAVERRDGPTALIFTRQAVPTLDRSVYSAAENLKQGAYVLADLGGADPQILLMASGSELGLIVEAGERLSKEGISVRLVSFPSWELFKQQPLSYQEAVLPKRLKKRISVEAGVAQGWERWVGDEGISISMDQFGRSAPYIKLFQEFGFTADHIIAMAKSMLGK